MKYFKNIYSISGYVELFTTFGLINALTFFHTHQAVFIHQIIVDSILSTTFKT